MSSNASFQVGDVVTKQYGKKPARIVRKVMWNDYWYCVYLHNKTGFEAHPRDLVHYQEEEPMTETKTLYSFKKEDGTVSYGNHIGTNSNNQYLIEEKGTGTIHVFNTSDLEEVLPYTFSASINGKETHYVCQPGAVKKGDFLLYANGTVAQVAIVNAVDTKNKSARAKFKGKKLVLEDI